MDSQALLLAAAAGAAALAVGASAWALIARRAVDAGDEALAAKLAAAALSQRGAQAAAEAFEIALIGLGDGPARLVAGEDTLAVCAARLSAASADATAVLEAI